MDLHQEFRKLVFDISTMKNKLISLLLEIYEKEIYKQHGCETIYEYAFKYAKLSKEVVQLALRTLKNTENKPELRKKIETVGLYKVATVATLATPETDRIYAKHVSNMSKPALIEFAKELRSDNENQKCQAVAPKMTIELDEEMQILFNKFKQKYGKEFSNQKVLRLILKKMEEVDLVKNTNGLNKAKNGTPGSVSRAIPAVKKREIQTRSNGKCEYTGCTKAIENYHHRIPFAFSRSHESVVGLCKVHHEFCHNGIIKHELKQPKEWALSLKPKKTQFDNLYLSYKT